MNRSGKTLERDFIKLTTATTLAAATSTTILAAEEPSHARRVFPRRQDRLGLIGAGGQGWATLARRSRCPGVELVAAADLYDGRLARAKEIWGNQLFTTRDYREVLARSDVDAVIIATPDHWHMRISNDAMKAGKDVYCEKPMVQQLEQGKHVIETAQKTGRIFQVGSQRVSSIVYKKAKDLLASGAIGELNMVEAWWDRTQRDRRVAVFDSAGRFARDRRLGPLSWRRAEAAFRCRCAFSAGATIATTARESRAICSFTCSPACTSSSGPSARRE